MPGPDSQDVAWPVGGSWIRFRARSRALMLCRGIEKDGVIAESRGACAILGHGYRRASLDEQRAGVADIARGFSALYRGQNRLQQRAGVIRRTAVSRETGEAGRRP